MDLVLCRPCGRITTELKDLMKNGELLKFYAFLAKLDDLPSEQFVQLCADCEKKLQVAFEFHRTCLSGESLRKTRKASIKRTTITKFKPSVKSVQSEKRSNICVPNTTGVLKAEQIVGEELLENPWVGPKKEPMIIGCTSPEDVKIINSVRRIVCPICKTIVFKSELEYHMNVHVLEVEKKTNTKANTQFPYVEIPPNKNGDRRFQCQFEGCRAILKKTIRTHMAKHFPEMRKNMCSICGDKFLDKVGYETHMNNHVNFVPFQCDQCPQKFRRKPHLLAHIRSKHQNVRYVCKDCGRQYSLASCFKFHVLLKHKGAKLICNVCQQSFINRTSIDHHLRKEHQIPFNQSIHFVLPNNEKLVRSGKITNDKIFTSEKIDEEIYAQLAANNESSRKVVENNKGAMEVEPEEDEVEASVEAEQEEVYYYEVTEEVMSD